MWLRTGLKIQIISPALTFAECNKLDACGEAGGGQSPAEKVWDGVWNLQRGKKSFRLTDLTSEMDQT